MRTGEAAACARVILEQTFVVCALVRTLDDSNILCQLSGSSILGNYIACRGIFVVYGKSIALNIADQIVLVANGSIKQIGTKEEIMPQLMEVAGVCDFYKK